MRYMRITDDLEHNIQAYDTIAVEYFGATVDNDEDERRDGTEEELSEATEEDNTIDFDN